jgi:hypothetical protein
MMVGLFVIWSNAFTAIKHLREVFGPMELVLARFLPVLAVSVVCLMSRRTIRKETFATIKTAPLKLFGMGIFGVTGSTTSSTSGRARSNLAPPHW